MKIEIQTDIPDSLMSEADRFVPKDSLGDRHRQVVIAARAIAAERERCARVADDFARTWGLANGTPAKVIAAAIREGGEA